MIDPSELRALLSALRKAEDLHELARAVLSMGAEVLRSPKAAWVLREGRQIQGFRYDGVSRFVSGTTPKETEDLVRLEPKAGTPVMRDGLDAAGLDFARAVVAPYDRSGASGFILVAGREDPYGAADLADLWALSEAAATGLDALLGRRRTHLNRLLGHYLRTPLWTVTLALEDIVKEPTPESTSLALSASRVLASQIDSFTCNYDVDDERFAVWLTLDEAASALRSLGEAWMRMERRDFEILLDKGASPSNQISSGGLQLLLTLVNDAFIDRRAQGISLFLKEEEGGLRAFLETTGLQTSQAGLLKNVVEHLARTFSVGLRRSRTVGGETMDLLLPLVRPVERELPRGGRPPRVLVTDDSDVNRETLCHLLRLWGAQALEARDGLEAVEVAEREPLDLIFMDLLMPRLEGIGAARRIRERGLTVPIVALTAGGTEDMVEALEAGMNDAIFKPVSGRLLQEILAQYTGFAPVTRLGRDEGARSAQRAMGEVFRREFGANRDALLEVIRSGDSAQAEMWAHRLKGEATQTGQLHLLPVLERIEAAARRGTSLSAYLEPLEALSLEGPEEEKKE